MKKKVALKFHFHFQFNLRYADDTVLIAKKKEDLQLLFFDNMMKRGKLEHPVATEIIK